MTDATNPFATYEIRFLETTGEIVLALTDAHAPEGWRCLTAVVNDRKTFSWLKAAGLDTNDTDVFVAPPDLDEARTWAVPDPLIAHGRLADALRASAYQVSTPRELAEKIAASVCKSFKGPPDGLEQPAARIHHKAGTAGLISLAAANVRPTSIAAHAAAVRKSPKRRKKHLGADVWIGGALDD